MLEEKQKINKLQEEHSAMYEQLDKFMHQLAKVKKTPNNPYLLKTSKEVLVYVKALLKDHFSFEEKELFPRLDQLEINLNNDELAVVLHQLLDDHSQIREKFDLLQTTIKNLPKKDLDKLDLQTSVLFPMYNLLGTISHHAAREDKLLLEKII